MLIHKYSYILILFLSLPLVAQDKGDSELKKEPPSFKLLRAEEHYTYLQDKSSNPFEESIFDPVKYVRLNQTGDMYLSFGGQFRPRFEYYSNRFWKADEDESFYSQRLALNSQVVFGKYFRMYGELYHGYTSHKKEFAEYDKLTLFQAFSDLRFPFAKDAELSIRFGRQEIGLGAARLVGIREGPNIRRSFDMGRIIYQNLKTKFQVFYGKEVRPSFEVFDNDFSLFDSNAINPRLWGVYTQFRIKGLNGASEVYYLGFQANNVSFNDVTGNEIRHTLGIRRFGKIGEKLRYNSEVIYQFGEHGDNDISAYNIETDWKYELTDISWNFTPGIKLEYTSGDKKNGDGKVNTFNPMFVNPAYYSLAATITPINMVSVHPSLSFEPIKKLKLYLEWAVFWRASEEDALYRPTRFINHPAHGIENKNIGNQFGLEAEYEVNRHISFEIDISYFNAGKFLRSSGEAESIFHVAPTLSLVF